MVPLPGALCTRSLRSQVEQTHNTEGLDHLLCSEGGGNLQLWGTKNGFSPFVRSVVSWDVVSSFRKSVEGGVVYHVISVTLYAVASSRVADAGVRRMKNGQLCTSPRRSIPPQQFRWSSSSQPAAQHSSAVPT